MENKDDDDDDLYLAYGQRKMVLNIHCWAFSIWDRNLLFTGHAMPIRSLCFSPDSQLLLTASDDGHMKLYDVYVLCIFLV